MNYKLFREFDDPFTFLSQQQSLITFKDSKLIEGASNKKHFSALAWDLTGNKLVTGAYDGFLRVTNTTKSNIAHRSLHVKTQDH